LLLWGADATAAKRDDLPFIGGVAHATDSSLVSVHCYSSGAQTVDCTIIHVIVRQPDAPAERAKRFAEYQQEMSGKKGASEFAKACKDFSKDKTIPTDPAAKRLMERARAACAANDAKAWLDATRAFEEEPSNQVCHFMPLMEHAEFTKVDATTWRSIENEICAETVVRTLSKAGSFWAYQETRTIPPPDPKDEMCSRIAKQLKELPSTITYDPRVARKQELRCHYWEAP
jgi:hypothetical protein